MAHWIKMKGKDVMPQLLIVLFSVFLNTALMAEDPTVQAEAAETSLLFASPAERRVMFRSIAQIAPSRKIEAGASPYPLESKPMDLGDVTFALEGKKFTLSDFLTEDAVMGMIVVKDDNILLEHYAEDMTEESVWVSFSVTKSLSSMLIGAAIQDGYIQSVDEPVVHYLPRLRGTSYENSTIRHVLNMASGVRWNEDYADPESDVSKAGADNGLTLVSYLADLPIDAEPGKKFNYNTGETNLVGEILRSAIGNNASTYLTHKIWQPFGMEFDANWMLGVAGGGELGGCCISATLRDYARLGVFALNDGQLRDGTRVLPENWMHDSTTPSEGYEGYGYLWWLFDPGYSALGIFGQRIQVFPDDGIVIAVQSNATAAVDTLYHAHQHLVVNAIRDHLLAD